MLKTLTTATLAVSLVLGAGAASADLTFPSLSYRTGPYAPNGIPFADGYADYFTLLNERDGGIGGAKINLVECETGYNTEKGVECYESTKGEGSLVYQPLSTRAACAGSADMNKKSANRFARMKTPGYPVAPAPGTVFIFAHRLSRPAGGRASLV